MSWVAHGLSDRAGCDVIYGRVTIEIYWGQPIIYGCGDCPSMQIPAASLACHASAS